MTIKLPPKTVVTCNFLTPLRTTNMDTDITGTENTFLEKLVPNNTYKPPPRAMTSTTHLIQFQRDLKDHMSFETHEMEAVSTKEMDDYSAMKSYLKKKNLPILPPTPNLECL
jgi:hypothetical protein